MADTRNDELQAFFRRSQQAVEKASADAKFMTSVVGAAERVAASLKNGGKVLLAGNGGSAADAQHIAAELVGRFVNDRAPLAAVALTTDTSALTAIGNDYGFEQVFARQVSALARPGDVFIGISTSGKSPNIVAALNAARKLGMVNIGMTRDTTTPMHALCDVTIGVPATETALIQQIHITAAHAICHLVERELFGAAAKG
jgi:D-sedoheptulose 7-phosphate isomerase